jgi:hypothetical protein
MTTDTLHTTIAALVERGDLTVRLVDDPDPIGLAEIRYELRAEGHADVVAALAADTVRYAYPVVTWQGREYPGGTCLVSEDPANPYGVLTLVDAIVDSFIGGQFDDLYPEVVR